MRERVPLRLVLYSCALLFAAILIATYFGGAVDTIFGRLPVGGIGGVVLAGGIVGSLLATLFAAGYTTQRLFMTVLASAICASVAYTVGIYLYVAQVDVRIDTLHWSNAVWFGLGSSLVFFLAFCLAQAVVVYIRETLASLKG